MNNDPRSGCYVRCIDNSDVTSQFHLCLNRVYQIQDVTDLGEFNLFGVEVSHSWKPDRFEFIPVFDKPSQGGSIQDSPIQDAPVQDTSVNILASAIQSQKLILMLQDIADSAKRIAAVQEKIIELPEILQKLNFGVMENPDTILESHRDFQCSRSEQTSCNRPKEKPPLSDAPKEAFAVVEIPEIPRWKYKPDNRNPDSALIPTQQILLYVSELVQSIHKNKDFCSMENPAISFRWTDLVLSEISTMLQRMGIPEFSIAEAIWKKAHFTDRPVKTGN